jgi:hypothetical protein
MGQEAASTGAAKLAQYFPDAIQMRMPVLVHTFGLAKEQFAPQQRIALVNAVEMGETVEKVEKTVIEFGTNREVLFVSNLQLEFEDRVRLKNQDGSLDEDATIIAVQLTDGKTVVAARFRQQPANWIIKAVE